MAFTAQVYGNTKVLIDATSLKMVKITPKIGGTVDVDFTFGFTGVFNPLSLTDTSSADAVTKVEALFGSGNFVKFTTSYGAIQYLLKSDITQVFVSGSKLTIMMSDIGNMQQFAITADQSDAVYSSIQTQLG